MRRVARLLTVAGLALTAVRGVRAQTLTSVTSPALLLAAPNEVQYDAGASLPTPDYAIATTCTGTGPEGCRLFLQYGSNPQGQQVDMEYAIVALGTRDCDNAVANPGAWYPVQPTAVVLTTRKNRRCVATFRFRVSPLAWTTYQSPGPPGGAWAQRVNFLFTRP
jgi:hypothetical protein